MFINLFTSCILTLNSVIFQVDYSALALLYHLARGITLIFMEQLTPSYVNNL